MALLWLLHYRGRIWVVYKLGAEQTPNLCIHTGVMARDLAVEQHPTWNGLVLNHLYGDCPTLTPVIQQRRCTSCLTSPLPRKWIFLYLLMSAHRNLRSCFLFKTVLNKLGDSYQAYINTYKPTLWLHTTEAQDNLWIEILLNIQRILIFQMITIMRTWIILIMQNRTTPTWKPLLET